MSNILAKFYGQLKDSVDATLLKDEAEQVLAQQVAAMETKLAPLFASGEYQQALTELSALREAVDTFFDKVMVMADDEGLKLNRLTLLARLQALFLQAADISLLQQ